MLVAIGGEFTVLDRVSQPLVLASLYEPLVQGYALALRLGATVDDLALGHYAFPTYGEGLHYAAEAAVMQAAVAR